MITGLRIARPSNFHVHLRFGEMLRLVIEYTAAICLYFLVMPNKPRIDSVEAWLASREEIAALNIWGHTPLITFIIDRNTTSEFVEGVCDAGAFSGKLYFDSGTTGSETGVVDIRPLWPVLAVMERRNIPLHVHAEKPGDPDIDPMAFVLDREVGCHPALDEILEAFPNLRVIVEHITCAETVEFVLSRFRAGKNIAATITPQHLRNTLHTLIASSLKVHEHCQPCAKTPKDREALIEAATSGEGCFFFGDDSAPHAVNTKECAEACSGVFNAPCSIETVVEVFVKKLGENNRVLLEARLERFLSLNGCQFFELPPPDSGDCIEIVRESWVVPSMIGNVVPWRAGQTIEWKVATGA